MVEVAWPWCKLVVYKASALASALAFVEAFAWAFVGAFDIPEECMAPAVASALAFASASASAFALVVVPLATELVAETCSNLDCSLGVRMLVSKVQDNAMGGHSAGLLELQHHPVVLLKNLQIET